MLLKGFCSHTSSNVQTTSLRLVLYVIEGASLPYFQYYFVYYFSTSYTWSLLQGHCSQHDFIYISYNILLCLPGRGHDLDRAAGRVGFNSD
jgi:hypothetical protein